MEEVNREGAREMAVVKYSLKADGDIRISENFQVKEFRCKDNSDTIYIDVDFVRNKLQPMRDYFGAPVIINSAYRTPEHNKKVKGATNSYHMKGRAFDIKVKGRAPQEIARYAQILNIHGIIQYNSFVHVDSRDSVYWARNNNGEITSRMSGF